MDKRITRSEEGGLKGLTKVFYNGLVILKEWGMIVLLKEYMWKSVWVVT